MKKIILNLILSFVLFQSITAQKDTIDNHIKLRLEAGAAIMTYLGSLNNQQVIFSANNNFSYRGGIRIDYKRIGGFIYYNTGKYSENKNIVANNANFLSKYNGGGIDIRIYPIKKRYYDVFFSAGFNYMQSSFYTDTLDAKGKPYYYWTDGTIRNQIQSYQNTFTSTQTKRDYTYESALGKKSFMFIPIGAGIELRLAERFKLGFVSQYYMSFSNNINAVKPSSKKEVLLYNSVSLSYVFIKIKTSDNSDATYKNVDFDAIVNIDSDGDGVLDMDDNCQGTGKGIKVDKHGCPLDSDGDGIIDVKDKEPKSKHSNYVDANGIEMTAPNIKDIKAQEQEDEALFSKMSEEEQDAEIEKRKKAYYNKLAKQYLTDYPPVIVDLDKDKKVVVPFIKRDKK